MHVLIDREDSSHVDAIARVAGFSRSDAILLLLLDSFDVPNLEMDIEAQRKELTMS